MNRYAIGVICALAGTILWGFSGCGAQVLTHEYGMSLFLLSSIRMPIAALIYLVVVLVGFRKQAMGMLRCREDVKQLAFFGIAGLYICQLSYVSCIAYTNAGTATVLEQLAIAITLVVSCVIVRRLPNKLEAVGMVCALLAVFLTATKGDPSTLVIGVAGLMWGLASAVTTTIFIMSPRKLFDKWGTVPATALGTMFGAALCIVALAVANAWCAIDPAGTVWLQELSAFPALDLRGWIALTATTVIGTCVSFALYLYGCHVVGSVRGSQLGATEPAAAVVISAVWLGTSFTWADWAGLVLMVITVLIISAAGKSETPQESAAAKE